MSRRLLPDKIIIHYHDGDDNNHGSDDYDNINHDGDEYENTHNDDEYDDNQD